MDQFSLIIYCRLAHHGDKVKPRISDPPTNMDQQADGLDDVHDELHYADQGEICDDEPEVQEYDLSGVTYTSMFIIFCLFSSFNKLTLGEVLTLINNKKKDSYFLIFLNIW